jgi:hypothetical protein
VTERPSARTNVKVDRENLTVSTAGTSSSGVEVVIPCISKGLDIVFHMPPGVAEFLGGKPPVSRQMDIRVKPEFRIGSVAGDMNVPRLSHVG